MEIIITTCFTNQRANNNINYIFILVNAHILLFPETVRL